MSIEDLPDYPLIKKLAEALWKSDTSYQGAAIMVGSGFSRSAAYTGDINSKLPLWFDLLKKLTNDMNSDPWGDPLRIAEEYSSYFGKQALRDLIEENINDSAWIPGDLYKSLLELPWSEVLTTNWDTLLERASSTIYKPVYSIVNKSEDLTSAYSPRIVKLHGTIKISNDLIFTQEDYRKYPQTHAGFVNLARQIFIENEFCLLGFSGDDPNFLQWVGWVRDQLTNHSRRIYLVGALNLTAPKRKYLESINIAPIDLSSLVTDLCNEDDKHRKATEIFLNALKDLKPKNSWDWKPATIDRISMNDTGNTLDHPTFIDSINKQFKKLKNDRDVYPNWLVCPKYIRIHIDSQLRDLSLLLNSFDKLTLNSQMILLYEIAWRHDVIFKPIPISLAQKMAEICYSVENTVLDQSQKLEMALILFKNAQWSNNEEFKRVKMDVEQLLLKASTQSEILLNELNYQNAINARETFNFVEMANLVNQIVEYSPIWKMRKASLLADLGKFDKGLNLIEQAYSELKVQSRLQPNSVYISSCLAWANYLINGVCLFMENEVERVVHDFNTPYLNPLEYLKHIDDNVTELIEQQNKKDTIEPGFSPGSYKKNNGGLSAHNTTHPLPILECLFHRVGLPISWDILNFVTGSIEKLIKLNSISNIKRFSLVVRSAKGLEITFSRISVALLDENEVDYILSSCIRAISYWSQELIESDKSEHANHCIRRIRIFLEVLARVSIRSQPQKSKEIFLLTCALVKKPKHKDIALIEVYSDLVKNTLLAMPKKYKQQVFMESLEFPLPSEFNITRYYDNSPNPIIEPPSKRPNDTNLDKRIREMISSIEPSSGRNAEVILRLIPLLDDGFLNAKEINLFKEKLWGKKPKYKNIPEIELLPFMLLRLPHSNHQKVKSLLVEYHFENNNLESLDCLMSIANGAINDKVLLHPTKSRALKLFEKFTNWRFTSVNDEDLPFIEIHNGDQEHKISQWIGYSLSQSIAPSLSEKCFNDDNFNKLIEFHKNAQSPEVLCALVYFAHQNNKYALKVERMIRESLYARDDRQTASSIQAIIKWCELDFSSCAKDLVTRIIYQINPNRTVGLYILINATNYLCSHQFLSEKNIESLTEIIPILFYSTDYRNISPSSYQAVNVTWIRSACVKLIKEIFKITKNPDAELQMIIKKAKSDPLPEVRFA